MPWDPTQPGATSQADNQYPAPAPTTLLASAARTTSGNMGNNGLNTTNAESVALELIVSAASGTSPTLVVSIEWSNDGTTWAAADPADAFAQLTAAGRRFKNVAVKGRFMRLVWTIGGTTPSFTFTANSMVLS